MKAITIWQPYASLIAAGLKRYETRSWSTSYRGLIAIHAGKRWNGELRQMWELLQDEWSEFSIMPVELPLGCIVAACRLIAVHRVETLTSLTELERAVGNYAPGRYAWELDVMKLPAEPIPAAGKQGIWDWEP